MPTENVSLSGVAGQWTEIEVAGHPCDVYEPPERNAHGYVVVYLHGVHLGRLVDKPEFCQEFDRHGLPVIAPITQRSWWTDKICKEFDENVTAERHLLDNIVPHLEERWQCRPPRIALLGTSMGGQGALRFAFKYPDTFPIVAAISPAIDYQHHFEYGDETLSLMYADPEAARQDTATLHVHPLNWPRNIWFACCPTDYPWHESAERLRMKLSALGIPYDAELDTPGGGHGFGFYSQMATKAVGYLAERLDKERRRVV